MFLVCLLKIIFLCGFLKKLFFAFLAPLRETTVLLRPDEPHDKGGDEAGEHAANNFDGGVPEHFF